VKKHKNAGALQNVVKVIDSQLDEFAGSLQRVRELLERAVVGPGGRAKARRAIRCLRKAMDSFALAKFMIQQQVKRGVIFEKECIRSRSRHPQVPNPDDLIFPEGWDTE